MNLDEYQALDDKVKRKLGKRPLLPSEEQPRKAVKPRKHEGGSFELHYAWEKKLFAEWTAKAQEHRFLPIYEIIRLNRTIRRLTEDRNGWKKIAENIQKGESNAES